MTSSIRQQLRELQSMLQMAQAMERVVKSPTVPVRTLAQEPELRKMLKKLPPRQQAVAEALVSEGSAVTYQEVADTLGIHLGTVHRHLQRVRENHPDVYAALMQLRAWQRGVRHYRAIERAMAHSRAWFRRKRTRRYVRRYGHWPYQRMGSR